MRMRTRWVWHWARWKVVTRQRKTCRGRRIAASSWKIPSLGKSDRFDVFANERKLGEQRIGKVQWWVSCTVDRAKVAEKCEIGCRKSWKVGFHKEKEKSTALSVKVIFVVRIDRIVLKWCYSGSCIFENDVVYDKKSNTAVSQRVAQWQLGPSRNLYPIIEHYDS